MSKTMKNQSYLTHFPNYYKNVSKKQNNKFNNNKIKKLNKAKIYQK